MVDEMYVHLPTKCTAFRRIAQAIFCKTLLDSYCEVIIITLIRMIAHVKPVYNPLYLQLREILLKKVVDGEYPKGTAIPSEQKLAEEFHTSVSTVRQALSTLVAEGILRKRQGRGTFIAEQTQEITFLSWLGETLRGQDILQELIAGFEQRNPAISIRVIPTTYYETRRELTRLISTGKAPDVAQIVSHWTSFFASTGAFEPLEGLLRAENLGMRYADADLLGGKYQNTLYSVSWGLCPMALIANKQVLREAGLELGPASLTLQDFAEACRRLGERFGDSKYSYGLCISGDETDFLRIYTFLQAFHGGFVDELGEVIFNSRENQEGFAWLRNFVAQARVCVNDIYILRKRFADGDIAFLSDGPWIRYLLEELTGEEFEARFQVLPNPVHLEKVSYSWNYNHALGICSQSKKKLHAARFIEALTADEQIGGPFYRRLGMLPVRRAGSGPVPGESEYHRCFRRQLENVIPINAQNAMFEKAMVLCRDAVKKILFEGADIARELNEKQYYLKMLYYG